MAGAFEKVKQGMNAVSENVQGAQTPILPSSQYSHTNVAITETFSGASKEANKSVAKDSNASASTR